jgi:hypothetical protein
MIIFNLLVFFNVQVSLFFGFLNPLCIFSGFWWIICSLLPFYFFYLFFFFLGGKGGCFGYIFSCDLISYGFIILSLWICVLMVLSRESVFRLGYFSGLFLSLLLCVLEAVLHTGRPLTQSDYTRSSIHKIFLLRMCTELLETCRGFK